MDYLCLMTLVESIKQNKTYTLIETQIVFFSRYTYTCGDSGEAILYILNLPWPANYNYNVKTKYVVCVCSDWLDYGG